MKDIEKLLEFLNILDDSSLPIGEMIEILENVEVSDSKDYLFNELAQIINERNSMNEDE